MAYVFKVYVSNVPVLLRDNRKLCEEVYMRGTSMYVRNYNGGNFNIDMLPKFLSCKYFSLNSRGLKDAIEFTFEFGLDGELLFITKLTHFLNILKKNLDNQLICNII